ncbi:hypothetical protein GCM10009741_30710 [Kribbella lupini]|uniref:Uncharacterized protein n=1 Tax=Kribbella lupini TaxID=291602 RepID=A0ABP4LNY7_9ACTN
MKVRRWVAITGARADGAFYAADVHTLSVAPRVVALGDRGRAGEASRAWRAYGVRSSEVRGRSASRPVTDGSKHTVRTVPERVRMAVTVYRVLPELGHDVAFDPDNVIADRRGLRFSGSGLSGRLWSRTGRSALLADHSAARLDGTRPADHPRQALDQHAVPRRTDEI